VAPTERFQSYTDLTVHDAPSGAFFVYWKVRSYHLIPFLEQAGNNFINALILFIRIQELHEKENYDTRHTEDEAEWPAHYGPDCV
jgi:hypothetical protein